MRALREWAVSSSNEHPPAAKVTDGDRTPPRMRVTWKTGPRTRAWDELWRWLLAPDELRPSASADTPASRGPERRRGS